jgi:hypothetical protein
MERQQGCSVAPAASLVDVPPLRLAPRQARAILEAAVHVAKEGIRVHPHIMIPLVRRGPWGLPLDHCSSATMSVLFGFAWCIAGGSASRACSAPAARRPALGAQPPC